MASPSKASAFAIEADKRPISTNSFTGYLVLAGLANAAIAALLLFRLPASREPSLRSLSVRALIYVAGAVLAGMAGARFYWNRSSGRFTTGARLSFRRFALVNAEAWVWVPAIVLLSREDSLDSALLAALSAALLANGLRRLLAQSIDPQNWDLPAFEFEEYEMFAATLQTPPWEAIGYFIAFALYLTGYFLIEHFYLIAGIPLAFSAFSVVWKLTPDLAPAPAPTTFSDGASTRADPRLASVTVAAVLVTFLVLLIGVGHRNRVEAASAALARRSGDPTGRITPKPAKAISGISGFESIILWPAPEKKQIVAPVLADISPLATRTVKPLVIHFDGAYWYFQPPDKRPGANAHQAHGSPLAVNIEANNFSPLTMAAVQGLRSAIPLARCREVQVSIENRDNIRGVMSLGVLLTDRSSVGEPSLSLGQQPILTSEPGSFFVKTSPADELLRFTVPERANIRKFDEITVLVLPDIQHFEVGPKIAVQQFALLRR